MRVFVEIRINVKDSEDITYKKVEEELLHLIKTKQLEYDIEAEYN